MDKFEFIEKAKYDCTEDEYMRIERVYLDLPIGLVGSNVTEFCAWFNKNGKMKAIDLYYPVAIEFAKQEETIKNLRFDRAHLEKSITDLEDKIRTQTNQIEFYEKCVTDSMLDAYLSELSREDKIAILSKRF